MLYPIVRPMADLALRTFFRKIHITHVDNIPRDKPVILAANHPTAFIEPCILACFLDRPLYFLVRGDLFRKPGYAKMLRALHMLPVYRMKDRGYAYIKHNYETFNYCYEALNDNKTVMILAEGRTIHEKRLRPLQKGTARIAFGTLEQYPDQEVYVVPVGVNYTYADRPGSDVMIDFGEPILASKYWKQYQDNPSEAITDLTEELRKELEKRVVIIERVVDEELTEHLLVLNRSERQRSFFPDITREIQHFAEEKAIADRVNRMEEKDRQNLLAATRSYFDDLEKMQLTDAALYRAAREPAPASWVLTLGWLPFQLARLFLWPPLRLAKYVADTRVKAIEFYSSVWMAVNIGAVLLYMVLWLLIAVISGQWWIFALLLVLSVLRYFGFWYRDYRRQWRDDRKVRQLSGKRMEELLSKRQSISQQWVQIPK